MALHLSHAFVDGIKRVLTRTGGIIFVLLLVAQGVVVASINSLVAAQVPPDAATEAGVGLVLPVSGSAAGALVVGSFLVTTVLYVVLARAFARPRTNLATFPPELYTRRIVRATLSLVVGGAIAFVAIVVGLVLFVFPGIFLATCFLFVLFTVGVEDRGPIGALRRSWDLSRGNRIRLAVLVVLLGIGGMFIGVVPTLFDIAGEPLLGDLASILLNGVLYVFTYGVAAAAYLQVADDE